MRVLSLILGRGGRSLKCAAEHSLPHPIRRLGLRYAFEQHVSLAQPGEEGGAFMAMLNVDEKFVSLPGRDFVVYVP